jgi:cytochrome c-type biogenesis protein CcmE
VVKVWGKVKSVNGTPPTTSTLFTISDGYRTDVTVMVNGAALPPGFDTTKTAIITGVLSSDRKIQAQTVRAVP